MWRGGYGTLCIHADINAGPGNQACAMVQGSKVQALPQQRLDSLQPRIGTGTRKKKVGKIGKQNERGFHRQTGGHKHTDRMYLVYKRAY
jgi:hypothetical protein